MLVCLLLLPFVPSDCEQASRPHGRLDHRPRLSGGGSRRSIDEDNLLLSPDGSESAWPSGPAPSHRQRLPTLTTRNIESYQSNASNESISAGPISPANTAARVQERIRNKQIDSLGLNILYEPDDSTPVADLVFLHGVGGGSCQTWTHGGRPDTFWPLDWLSTEHVLRGTRISSFGYNTQLTSNDPDRLLDISDHAKDLLAKLRFGTGRESRSLNIGRTPLIFISHSLGGLVAKKAFILAQSESNAAYAEIAQAVVAFVFLATPQRGSQLSTVLNDILSACVTGWVPNHHGTLIRRHVKDLQDVNEQFRDLAPYVDVVSFYERQHTQLGSATDILILRQDQATLDHSSETAIPLDANHLTITKFKSRGDSNYTSVRGVLQYLVEKSRPRRRSTMQEDTSGQAQKVNELLGYCAAPEDDYSFFADKRIPGSCEWVLDHTVMESFLSSPANNPQILWSFGGPGSGKSVTATFVIGHLMDMSMPSAYYYFRSGDQVKNNLAHFLTSVAFQLSSCIPEYRRKLCALADARFDVGKAGYKLLWKKLFLGALLACDAETPFFLVLDGLDELSQVKELLQRMFVELGESSIPLRLLLISRPTPDIETSIDRLSRRINVQRLPLDGNAQDLAMYVQDEMEVMMGDDDFKVRIQNEVLSKANGNFLWAHLVVQEILECQTEVQVENALRQVPKELEPLYWRMDVQLADTFRSRAQDKAMGHMILMWATCSRYPLLLEELRTALQPDFPRIMDMRSTVQKLCREFVVVDKKDHVSMMHSSAREFLMSNQELNYYIHARKAHQVLFCKCMHALSASRGDLETVGKQTRTFLTYAASSWPFHLTHSHGYEDQRSLSALMGVFKDRTVLNWMFTLAKSGRLRTLVEASRALADFLKAVDRADKERSPLMHRLQDKGLLQLWAQDLIRIVGKFGVLITQHPRAIYNMIPTFCPKESIIHREFAPAQSAMQMTVRGKSNPTWDDCFAKFAVASESLPHTIWALERYFAILTKEDGTVHLYFSSTCEAVRVFTHGEIVLTICIDSTSTKLATYGFRKTKIWDIHSGRHLFSIENPQNTKALAMSFVNEGDMEDVLLTFSADRVIRSCSLDSMRIEWSHLGDSFLGGELAHLQHANAPQTAQFSPDGLYVAIAYRGAHPSVWYLGGQWPQFIAQCDHRARSVQGHLKRHTNFVYAQTFAWNPISGHLLGTYNDGFVFKWHPRDGDFDLSEVKCTNIECSGDGKTFVTGSGDGTLRIWDFEHFSPIYQLKYPHRIQDLEIGRNEARIYDIRDQYCNVWEPNALLRAMEWDDRVSDTMSSRESSQPSMTSEAYHEDFEPITAFKAQSNSQVYAIGDDAGLISVFNFDGILLSEVQCSPMSVEMVAWCENENLLASVDLVREVKVRRYFPRSNGTEQWPLPEDLRSFAEVAPVMQLLFSANGSQLMLVTPTALKFHQTGNEEPPNVLPSVRKDRWMLHPLNAQYAVGLGAEQLRIVPWDHTTDAVTLLYDNGSGSKDVHLLNPLLQLHSRRPSHTYPTSPSELETSVHKTLVSPDGKLLLVEIYGSTNQARRRSDCLLIETQHIEPDRDPPSVPVSSLPLEIAKNLWISLGFIEGDDPVLLPSHRPSLSPAPDSRRSISRRGFGQQTFVFVDNEFWVCSVNIGGASGQLVETRKHFFLPRDWQNTEWLEMATVTPSGHFLCPRNGDIAVVSNGFMEEWLD